jgi:hypothetical protein
MGFPLLSVAVATFQFTTAVGALSVVYAVTFGWHVIMGGMLSATMTLKEHMALLFDVSIAEQVTTVDPSAKDDPEGGEHATESTATLSVAVATG